jgi:hypothetical protein
LKILFSLLFCLLFVGIANAQVESSYDEYLGLTMYESSSDIRAAGTSTEEVFLALTVLAWDDGTSALRFDMMTNHPGKSLIPTEVYFLVESSGETIRLFLPCAADGDYTIRYDVSQDVPSSIELICVVLNCNMIEEQLWDDETLFQLLDAESVRVKVVGNYETEDVYLNLTSWKEMINTYLSIRTVPGGGTGKYKDF